jgi:hypothetical protein
MFRKFLCNLRRVLDWLFEEVEMVCETRLSEEELALINADRRITLSEEDLNKFKRGVLSGYYKSLYKEGIINASQLEKLMQM